MSSYAVMSAQTELYTFWRKALNIYSDIFPFSLFLVAVHIIAHLFNFEFFMDAQLNRNTSLLTFVLSEIGNGDNASFLNPIRTNETVSCCHYQAALIFSFLVQK